MVKIQTNMRLSQEARQTIEDIRNICGFRSDAQVVTEALKRFKTAILEQMAAKSLDENPIVRN